ncbi:unnamed protein product [Rhizoctonia solani]|uniref:Protein kinase domain-containing protein n=1 Tax=Rhizoctonia solani TaxID=456999 RepID=A0A8H2W881_9AGAM|nr:unnamed protein product [Rhizoctonia solani]
MLVLHTDLPAHPEAPEINSTMPASDIIAYLVQYGCPDVTDELDARHSAVEPVAVGGCSDVYDGKLLDGTPVAIKCPRGPTARYITSQMDSPDKTLKRAAKELYTWSTFRHPNIAKLLGVAMYQGRMSMVSPWISPGNFYSYISMHRNMANHFDLCVQVAEGLAYLHGNNVVHGDLKACNVLVNEEGEVKLTDFGLSVLEESALRFTASQNHCEGTARWMAPELIKQTSPRCMETDVYAFGMTVIEIMTEAIPFSDIDNNGRVMYIVANEGKTPPKPSRLNFNSARNDAWWLILLQCWDPSARYRPTIEQVLRGLTDENWEHLIQHALGGNPRNSNSRTQCFGVTVGINSLSGQGDSESHFQGAVNDADRVAKFLRHRFNCEDRTISLRNDLATPPAIIKILEHLLNNPIVQKGDHIVFYYAGPVFEDLDTAFLNFAEYQEGVLNEESEKSKIRGTTESLLADVMEKLALLKGCRVYIILDLRRSHPHANPPSDTQSHCFSTKTRLSDGLGNRSLFEDSAPYVLLSGSGDQRGMSHELNDSGYGGYFTDALLKSISHLGSLPTTTFEGLLHELRVTIDQSLYKAKASSRGIKIRSDRIPVCYGSVKNQIIFTPGRSPAFPVQYFDAEDGMWILKAGSRSGVTLNSAWDIFATTTAHQNPTPIGTSLAKDPGQDTTRLEPRNKHEIKNIMRAFEQRFKEVSVYAVPMEGASNHPLRVYIDIKERLEILDKPSSYARLHSSTNRNPATHYITQSTPEDADIIVRCLTHNPGSDLEHLPIPGSWEGLELQTEAMFYLQTPRVLAFHQEQPLLCGIGPVDDIASALMAAAWWNWHLDCINTPTLLQTKISVQLLKLGEWKGSTLLRCGTTPLHMSDAGVVQLLTRPQDRYGIRIVNDANLPLYAWVFYFSASDLSIRKLFGPVQSLPNIPPGESITIGDEICSKEIVRIGFALNDNQSMDIGFVKVFWSTGYLNMSEVAQSAPCCDTHYLVSSKPGTFLEDCPRDFDEWGAVTITIVQVS